MGAAMSVVAEVAEAMPVVARVVEALWVVALAQAGKPLHCPNVFITVTMNEWDFPFHSYIAARFKGLQMTDFQGPMTLDIYRILIETMQGLLASGNDFFDEVHDYCIRVEFQGRCTLHIHVVAWAIIKPGVRIEGRVVDNRWSPFVRLLHKLLNLT